MDISFIGSVKGLGYLSGFEPEETPSLGAAKELQEFQSNGTQAADPRKVKEVAIQFEAILTRQFLSETLKPMLETGPSAQVYSYYITDALAEAIGKGGGLGLSPILENQLKQ